MQIWDSAIKYSLRFRSKWTLRRESRNARAWTKNSSISVSSWRVQAEISSIYELLPGNIWSSRATNCQWCTKIYLGQGPAFWVISGWIRCLRQRIAHRERGCFSTLRTRLCRPTEFLLNYATSQKRLSRVKSTASNSKVWTRGELNSWLKLQSAEWQKPTTIFSSRLPRSRSLSSRF